MHLRTGQRWGRLLAGAMLSLLASILFAPSTARASCGDYVHIGSKASRDAMPAPAHGEPMPAGHDEKPCSGPLCSNDTSHLPMSPVTRISIQVQDLGCLPCDLLPADGWIISSLFDAPDPLPECPGTSIFHPPRPLS